MEDFNIETQFEAYKRNLKIVRNIKNIEDILIVKNKIDTDLNLTKEYKNQLIEIIGQTGRWMTTINNSKDFVGLRDVFQEMIKNEFKIFTEEGKEIDLQGYINYINMIAENEKSEDKGKDYLLLQRSHFAELLGIRAKVKEIQKGIRGILGMEEDIK